MSRFAVLPVALILLLTAVAPVAAATPTQSTTTGTYTLADAIFDYENFDIYDGDCGDFVLLVDFHVVREVTTWPDREIRHVRYEGHFYNATDTSKSIVRSGDFLLTFRFDETGALVELTQTGLFEYVEVDGHRVPTIAGRSTTDFTLDPPINRTTPRASTQTAAFVCDALR
jgi:hypothetical protein